MKQGSRSGLKTDPGILTFQAEHVLRMVEEHIGGSEHQAIRDHIKEGLVFRERQKECEVRVEKLEERDKEMIGKIDRNFEKAEERHLDIMKTQGSALKWITGLVVMPWVPVAIGFFVLN